ncbi:MAG: SpoIVB peptidase S55 domain-containing protein [Bryobacteraceae bacterium]
MIRPTYLAKAVRKLLTISALVVAGAAILSGAQDFFPLKDVRPGLHGIGRTVFESNRVEEFQVEILGVIENVGPKQAIILAKLSGGPLEQTGVLQGMSGSPVYIDGKLLGAIALGFPFSKQPIAGIQPIQQMIADADFGRHNADTLEVSHNAAFWGKPLSIPNASRLDLPIGNLTEILTPVALSGFTPGTLQAFSSDFRKLGLQPQQGVSAGSPKSQQYSGTVVPGSMISVELVAGDLSISADGTVTHVDGKRVYAFGHRFLEGGSTELPFARADVVALLPTLNTSFKISTAKQWVGTIISDRNTSIAGEMGREAHMLPVAISVRSRSMGTHDYHMQVVNDRLLTPFLIQTAIFSAIDATERTLGVGTLRLRGTVQFEGDIPSLLIRDIFVSDSSLAQQVSADAVVSLAFTLSAGFTNLHIKNISFDLEPVEAKRQLQVSQVWTSRGEVRPGDSVEVTALLAGEDGREFTRTATYHVPVGAPLGQLNLTVSDANGLNFPDFAGMSPTSLHTPQRLITVLNRFRSSDAAYVRIWRQEPSFSVAGPLAGGDLTDPPPSVMLILANPSTSLSGSSPVAVTRGSDIAEFSLPVGEYVVSGAKTVQVEVKE